MILTPEKLLEPCREFDFDDPPFDPAEFSRELVRCMIDSRGLGLAANQVGVPYRIFALFTQPLNTVCFNPIVVDVGDEEIDLEEGCLSYPGLFINIKRPKNIKVRFRNPNGEHRTEKYTGMTSRAFQHELTHLDGVPFWKGASRTRFDRARRRSKINVTFSGRIIGEDTCGAQAPSGAEGSAGGADGGGLVPLAADAGSRS